jgi:DNA-binding PadR family transcriptional regulator
MYLGFLGMTERQAVRDHLDLLLLAVLRDEPAHGYAVIETLRRRSGEKFDMPEGTVYPALHRLERLGLVRSAWVEVNSRRRRIYRLTAFGRRALDREQREWEGFASAVRSVLAWGAS